MPSDRIRSVLFAEEETIRAYLGRIGRRRDGFAATGALVELYDLSDPERGSTGGTGSVPRGQQVA